jgi:hypothetical protein
MNVELETDWFRCIDLPIRIGVYKVRFLAPSGPRKMQHGYSYWNGEYWSTISDTPKEAAKYKVARGYQGKEWKGLTEEGYEHQKNAN